MKRIQSFVRALLLCTLMATGFLAFARPALAAPTPVFIAGNVTTCTNINGVTYDHSFSTGGSPASGVPIPLGGGHTVTFYLTPVAGNLTASVQFVSTLPLSAVIVKGGNDAYAYIYSTPVLTDSGLVSPLNNGGNVPNVSHVVVCWDNQPLKATKTADGTFERTIEWALQKSVDPANHVGFMGDTFDSTWTVKATKQVTDGNYKVTGKITINNPNTIDVNFSVADTLNDGTIVGVVCPSATVAAGGSVVCTYESLPTGDDITVKITENTAVITSNTPDVGGATAKDPVEWTAKVIGYDEVTLTDELFGYKNDIKESKTETFPQPFDCPLDPTSYKDGKFEKTVTNTAALTKGETLIASKEATATLTCYAVSVHKTAETSLSRTWTWNIDKSGDQTALTLQPGQTYLVNYDVLVTANLPADSLHQVSGDIEVHNPAPIDALINQVSDVITPDNIDVTLACNIDGVDFVAPYSIPGGKTLVCTYSQALEGGANRTNTATATLQNYDNGTKSGTTNVTHSAAVDFTAATVNKVDECVTVSDNKYSGIAQVCVEDAPKLIEYSLNVGPYTAEQCGTVQTFVNTASFETVDSKTTGSDPHEVKVTVSCSCTLTQGYWKTHSSKGPAPYDDTWAKLSAGADTYFFGEKTGNMTYHQVLWTAPAGNAYYQLAHQYIAAQLNQLSGSSVPADVNAALTAATTLFNTYTPGQIGGLPGNNQLRKQFVNLSGTLGNYNEGKIGPGHCSEDATSNVSVKAAGLAQSQTLFMPVTIRP